MTYSPIISIFMPVYNGSQFLKKSIDSVLNQTFHDFELVCIDDSSTDDSFSILENYSQIDNRVVILKKPNGGDVPKSWNYAMPYLRGKFITYMSQDDWMSIDNLELNYKRHLETGANIIVPDMVPHYDDKETFIFSGVRGDRNVILTGREAFVLSINWKIHGFCLCKSEIMKSEPFDENSFNSDEYVTRKNFLLSKKVAFSKGTFYYYKSNSNAITKKFKLHTLTALLTDQRLIDLMKENNIRKSIVYSYIFKSFLRMIYYLYRWKTMKGRNAEMNKMAKTIFNNHIKYLINM
jgi:glycosyltransferase involved in cell wall biosynthesis